MPTLRSSGRPPPHVQTSSEGVIAMLKRDAAEFRREDFSGDYSIDFDCSEAMEEAVLPHWKDFVAAIRSSDPENQFWEFREAKLPQKFMEMLQDALASRNIHTLEVCMPTGDQFEPFAESLSSLTCEVLEKSTSIKRLVCRKGLRDLARHFRAVEKHTSLEELHLVRMKFDHMPTFVHALHKGGSSLKHLSLRDCGLSEGGIERVAGLLSKNYLLESLYLGDIDIADSDAAKILVGLRRNTNLRFLGLAGTSMTEAGRKTLCKALFRVDAVKLKSGGYYSWGGLDSVARSNHTCSVQVVSGIDPCPTEALLDVLNSSSCPKENRRFKILSFLYATNGEGTCNEFSFYQRWKLIPEILAYIADESVETLGEESTEDSYEQARDGVGEQILGGLKALARSLMVSGSPPASGHDDAVESDALSVESDVSFDGYDSELEELDEAFEEEEGDAVYEDFHKSFTDPSFSGKRVQLTVTFQVLKRWGLPLLDKTPPLSDAEIIRQHVQNAGPKQKKMRREIASLAH